MRKSEKLSMHCHTSLVATLNQGFFQLFQETLELMEKRGGPDAFINIKYDGNNPYNSKIHIYN